jgi:hypothetical protein
MLKFNPPQKFYDENIFNIIEDMQGKNFTLTFDKNELLFYYYDTFNLKEELKDSKLVVEQDIFASLLVFDADNQAHFVLHYKKYLESIEAHPLKKGISFFKFMRELEKLTDTEHMHELTPCQINWTSFYSTFGLHKDGEIKYFMIPNYDLVEGKHLREVMKEMQWDQEPKTYETQYQKREILKTKEGIEAWLEKYNITKYSITPDLVVNAHQKVVISGDYKDPIYFIPFQFGKVDGSFTVEKATLENLEGFPQYVTGNFDVYGSSLKSLKGGPHTVMGDYDIMDNLLNSLEFCASYVGGRFKALDVPIKTLEFLPQTVGGDLDLSNCRIKTLDINIFKDVDIGKNLVINRRIGIPFEGFENLYTDDRLILSKAQINQLILKDKLEGDLVVTPVTKKIKI